MDGFTKDACTQTPNQSFKMRKKCLCRIYSMDNTSNLTSSQWCSAVNMTTHFTACEKQQRGQERTFCVTVIKALQCSCSVCCFLHFRLCGWRWFLGLAFTQGRCRDLCSKVLVANHYTDGCYTLDTLNTGFTDMVNHYTNHVTIKY